jgi:hypothetical protein
MRCDAMTTLGGDLFSGGLAEAIAANRRAFNSHTVPGM